MPKSGLICAFFLFLLITTNISADGRDTQASKICSQKETDAAILVLEKNQRKNWSEPIQKAFDTITACADGKLILEKTNLGTNGEQYKTLHYKFEKLGVIIVYSTDKFISITKEKT